MAITTDTRSAFKADMTGWISASGSEHLRRAAADHNVTGLYIRERAAVEFPAFTYLRHGDLEVSDRANPTPEALHLLEQTRSEVARLGCAGQYVVAVGWISPRRSSIDDEDDGLRARLAGEVVYVANYLGREDIMLVQPTDSRRELRYAAERMRSALGLGVNVVDAAELVADWTDDRRVAHAFTQLAEALRSGSSVGSAVDAQPLVFPAHWAVLLDQGQEVGMLADAFKVVADNR